MLQKMTVESSKAIQGGSMMVFGMAALFAAMAGTMAVSTSGQTGASKKGS